jgi:hypothetical protein
MSVMRRVLIGAYLIEAGLLLIVAPWTNSWQHNYFVLVLPALGRAMLNEFVRGAISGIGLITLFSGLRDLRAALEARRAAARALSEESPPPPARCGGPSAPGRS